MPGEAGREETRPALVHAEHLVKSLDPSPLAAQQRAIRTADLLATAASTTLRRRPLGLPPLLNLFDDSPPLSASSPSQALAAAVGCPPAACTRAVTPAPPAPPDHLHWLYVQGDGLYDLLPCTRQDQERVSHRTTTLALARLEECAHEEPPLRRRGLCLLCARRRFCPAVDITLGAPCSAHHHASENKCSCWSQCDV